MVFWFVLVFFYFVFFLLNDLWVFGGVCELIVLDEMVISYVFWDFVLSCFVRFDFVLNLCGEVMSLCGEFMWGGESFSGEEFMNWCVIFFMSVMIYDE